MRSRSSLMFGLVFFGALGFQAAYAGNDGTLDLPQAIASATASGDFDFDEARLTFSINNEGADASDLAGKLAKKGTGLVEAIKALGVADGDIRVSGPSISVRYAIIRNTNGTETIDRQKIDGFTGFIAVTARFKDFSKLGKAMSDGVKIGAAISGPTFSLAPATSEEKLSNLAIEATKSAFTNAKSMIEATGRKAGRILSIRAEGGIQPLSEAPMRALAVAAPAPDLQIPVSPGRATLTKSITVIVEILEP